MPHQYSVVPFAATVAVLSVCAGVASAQVSSPATIGSQTLTTSIAKALAADRTASSAAQGASSDDGWNVAIYPVLLWVPSGIDIDVELPPDGGGDAGEIVDGRFDGAYLGGFYASKGWFRVDWP